MSTSAETTLKTKMSEIQGMLVNVYLLVMSFEAFGGRINRK